MNEAVCLLLVFLSVHNALAQQPDSTASDFILSADISFLEQLEKAGAVYREDGVPDDLFAILGRNGINTVRLRLWHTPAAGWNDLESTVALAGRIEDAGLDFFLDFHYSDTWADPGRQTKPSAWAGLSFDLLRDSLYAYTHRVMSTLKDAGALPAYVQIGNEISQGFLWDEGRVGGNFNSALQWSRLRTLLNDAIRAVRDASGDEHVQIVIHTDRGGDVAGATWFFDNVTSHPVDFDVIGLSYYPWWHGTLDAMQNTINTVTARYGKPVLLAETAYPWTLQWFDNTNNLVGLSEHLLAGYDDLPDAQYRFLRDLIAIVRDVPDGLGAGVSYWAPEFIAVPGVGSSWENVTLFDDAGELLPSIRAFEEAASVPVERPETNDAGPSLEAYPNPFLQTFKLTLNNPDPGTVSVLIYDMLGRQRISVFEDRWLPAGSHTLEIDTASLPAGLYLCSIEGPGERHSLPIIRR